MRSGEVPKSALADVGSGVWWWSCIDDCPMFMSSLERVCCPMFSTIAVQRPSSSLHPRMWLTLFPSLKSSEGRFKRRDSKVSSLIAPLSQLSSVLFSSSSSRELLWVTCCSNMSSNVSSSSSDLVDILNLVQYCNKISHVFQKKLDFQKIVRPKFRRRCRIRSATITIRVKHIDNRDLCRQRNLNQEKKGKGKAQGKEQIRL
eukprot:m.27688 g.27688  ORF g.27688 m.27688 type:complete len:202 (-) comp15790_c0_seq1:206-811(-)